MPSGPVREGQTVASTNSVSPLGLGHVATKVTRGGELAQLVTNHVLADIDRYVPLSVVDRDRHSHHGGSNRRGTRPCSNDALLSRALQLLDLLGQSGLNVRALLYRSRHGTTSSLVFFAAAEHLPSRIISGAPHCDAE